MRRKRLRGTPRLASTFPEMPPAGSVESAAGELGATPAVAVTGRSVLGRRWSRTIHTELSRIRVSIDWTRLANGLTASVKNSLWKFPRHFSLPGDCSVDRVKREGYYPRHWRVLLCP